MENSVIKKLIPNPSSSLFSNETMLNLLVSALEGGSNYWYYFPDLSMLKKDNTPTVDRIFDALLDGKKIEVRDVESGEYLGTLTIRSLNSASYLMFNEYTSHFADVLSGNDDATTADVFFQLAVMQEVIYG